jgi:hypothetical protein
MSGDCPRKGGRRHEARGLPSRFVSCVTCGRYGFAAREAVGLSLPSPFLFSRPSIPSHGPWFAVPLGAILPRGPQSDMAIILANGDFSRLKLQTAPMPPSNRLFVSAPRHKDS